eukprot:GHVS01053242.1.p1 GENE.GHVS01053242.1~~GHVS01053242.1.p1  ORF type:complete len:512 (+),score=110.06 GHVS01053242.1:500-2035(+)
MFSPSHTMHAPPASPSAAAKRTVDAAGTTRPPPSKDFKIYKAVMCQYHASGRCRKGTMCTFAHSSNELRAYPDMRKHKLCAAWLSSAGCPDTAETCMYAHGVEQMQKAKMCAVNKPALCVPFFEGGGCSKGLTCSFAHSIGEVDTAYQASLQRHQSSLLGESPAKQTDTNKSVGGLAAATRTSLLPTRIHTSARSSTHLLPPPPPPRVITSSRYSSLSRSAVPADAMSISLSLPPSQLAAATTAVPSSCGSGDSQRPLLQRACERLPVVATTDRSSCSSSSSSGYGENGECVGGGGGNVERKNSRGSTDGSSMLNGWMADQQGGKDKRETVVSGLEAAWSRWELAQSDFDVGSECGDIASPCTTDTRTEQDAVSVRTSEEVGSTDDLTEVFELSPRPSIALDCLSSHQPSNKLSKGKGDENTNNNISADISKAQDPISWNTYEGDYSHPDQHQLVVPGGTHAFTLSSFAVCTEGWGICCTPLNQINAIRVANTAQRVAELLVDSAPTKYCD